MSARRQARAGDVAEVVTEAGGIPRALLIGRCIEVWADPADGFPLHSARIRFNSARSWWLRTAGVSDHEGWQLIPDGAPWSVEYLTYRGQAEHVGRPVSEMSTSGWLPLTLALRTLPTSGARPLSFTTRR